MLVHLLVSGLFAAIVWRATGSGLLAGLFWLGITGAMGEVGRPEEYALLFGTLAVLSVESTLGRLALCIPLLGMSGAISPLTLPVDDGCRRSPFAEYWMEVGLHLACRRGVGAGSDDCRGHLLLAHPSIFRRSVAAEPRHQQARLVGAAGPIIG